MTVKKIYDLTMSLMDEMLDNKTVTANPETDYKSTKDYTARTPGILEILASEVVSTLKGYGVDIDYIDSLENMDSEVDLEDSLCRDVLTYGLAARLLGQEDRDLSLYFSNLYDRNLIKAKDAVDGKPKGKQYSGENIYGLMRAGD